MNEKNHGDEAGRGSADASGSETQDHRHGCRECAKKYASRAEAFIDRHGSTIEIVSTAVIAVFTVALFAVGRWQYQTSQQATKAAENSNAVAAAAMKSSREMTESIERPWVLFDEHPRDNPLTPEREANWASQEGFGIFIRNFGRAPAFDVYWSTWGGQPEELGATTPATGWLAITQPGLLAPGESLQALYYWAAYPETALCMDLNTPMLSLVVVRYRDQFDRPHLTTFCNRLSLGNRSFQVQFCYGHGYAD